GRVIFDPARDHRTLGHHWLDRAVVDEPAAYARLRADDQFLRAHFGVAMHLAVDAHRRAGGIEVLVRVAVEGHSCTGERRRAGNDRRGPHGDVAACQTGVSGYDGVELHVATGGIQVVAHAAAEGHLASDDDQVALDLARD